MTQATEEPVLHILWMNGGLGCDGDSVALTAATQPSIEEIVLGALPDCPRWRCTGADRLRVRAEQGADNFIEWWHKADRGELDPFVLVSRDPSRTRRSSPRVTGAASATTRRRASR